jgi:class 3 adenylate cyclase
MQQIADWLEKLDMSEYAQRFADERIDFSVLPDLTDQDLKDLGVVLGDRRKILRAIAKLDAAPANITPIPKQSSILSVAALQPVSVTEEASERRHATVMFCDLADSTGIAAARFDAEELCNLVGFFGDAASAAITDMGGTVVKKLDNGLMALFGYPATQENDAERAVRAALATQRALTELSPINAGTRRPALAARITIDSGPVVIDAAGEIFGDLLNIVMQAKALAEPGVVLITARVQRQVANLFVAKERGSHKLKDVPEAVTLYRIVRPTSGGHRRPNYDRLLARAVNGVDMSTAQARHAVYERARNALVAQLRFNQPALSKADVTKERLALEEAIRKVEAEAARNSRTEIAAEPRSATTPAGAPDGGAQVTSGPPQPNRANAPLPWAGGVAEEPPKKSAAQGFRDVHALGAGTAKAAKSVGQTRDAYDEEAPQYPNGEPAASSASLYSGDLNSIDYDTRQEGDLEPAFAPAEEQPIAIPPVRRRPRRLASADGPTLRPLSYGGLATLLGVLIILAAVVTSIFWQWSPITEFYQFFSHTGTKQQSQVSNEYRVLPKQGTGRAQGVSVPYAQVAPAIAQHVVLHEEDRNDQQHRQYRGTAIWRTELVSAGVAPQLAIIADAEIPERRMTVAWSLRRNIDKSLPASHTIEIKFNLPADFPGGGIANVSGILMAQAEQTRGSPLAGLAVKMTDVLFVIGLSAADPDIQRNEQLLKGRSWLYIPIVYTNGGRAILALEKGPSGDRAFAEAFTAWEEK